MISVKVLAPAVCTETAGSIGLAKNHGDLNAIFHSLQHQPPRTDLSLWDRFIAVYVMHFRGAFPARAFLGSAPLLLNARFEMMGIAVKR